MHWTLVSILSLTTLHSRSVPLTLVFHFQDINAAIAAIKTKRTIEFVDWCPTGFKIGTLLIIKREIILTFDIIVFN